MKGDVELTPNPMREWFAHLLAESDRGCIIIAHAILEERLADVIESHLRTSHDGLRSLIAKLREERSNPLSGFTSRLDFAIQLGLVPKHNKKILLALNTLRVKFAHYKAPRNPNIEPSQAQAIYDLLTPAQQDGVCLLQQKFWPYAFKHKCFSKARKRFTAIAATLINELELWLLTHPPKGNRPH